MRAALPSQDVARPEPQPEQAQPDSDGFSLQTEPGRQGRKRLARPAETPDGGPEGRKSASQQKLTKRTKPGSEEFPKADAVREEPARDAGPKNETARQEDGKPETGKSSGEGGKGSTEAGAETAKPTVPGETGAGEPPALRADPVPPVTPAPPAAPAVSASVSSTPEPPQAEAPPQPVLPPPATVAASAPPLPPVAPAGPPAPPISR